MKIIRFKELQKIIGVSRSSIERWEHKNLFPKRINLGTNSVGWHEEEIIEWINNRKRTSIE